jgi:hypothetical protein
MSERSRANLKIGDQLPEGTKLVPSAGIRPDTRAKLAKMAGVPESTMGRAEYLNSHSWIDLDLIESPGDANCHPIPRRRDEG